MTLRSTLGAIFRRPSKRKFFAWQIELTTRCPLRCRMCIRASRRDWHTADMDIDDFRKIVPYLSEVHTTVLEGWGEPLLYRDLVTAVRLVKSTGCRAGFVTSGWGLDHALASDLISAGLDFMGFSLAGATSGTHNGIRVNSDFASVSKAIGEVVRIKSDRNSPQPNVHIVFLMLRDNLHEVTLLPELARDLGINEVILINLIQVTDEWQEEQRIFLRDEAEIEAVLDDAEARAGALGIKLRRPSLAPLEVAVCDEMPLRNLFISVEGRVSPCVYLGPPISGQYGKIFQGHRCNAERLSFGNIFSQDLAGIWNDEKYADFRNRMILRKQAFDELFQSSSSRNAYLKGKKLPDPPEPCKTCHKMLGL